MECYEGATMIKTFRGMIADGGQDKITLHTNDGATGYRVVKFQVLTNTPGVNSSEVIAKIYKVEQSTVTTTFDFSDQTLLGGVFFGIGSSGWYNASTIIFDREIFNQDIYVTIKAVAGTDACNYYIELEQMKLDLNENTVATLKDIRNELRIPPA